MADHDQSLYNLRYNQITQGIEGFGGGVPQWTPLTLVADGGINQLTGDVTAGPGVGSQAATISAGAVTNAKVSATAAIAYSKLAALPSSDILVGSAGNVATAVALSGDATLANTGALTLANTAVTAGSYTNASLTVDAKGRLTAASSGTAPVTSVSGTASDISSTGGTTPVLDLVNTAVTPGSYTSANITVDAKGRLTAASSGSSGAANIRASAVTAQVDTTGNTPVDMGFSTIITPTSSSHHVLLDFTLSSILMEPDTELLLEVILLRGGTPIQTWDRTLGSDFQLVPNGQDAWFCVSLMAIDAPATTSATTYTVQVAAIKLDGTSAAGNFHINSRSTNPNALSVLSATEIP